MNAMISEQDRELLLFIGRCRDRSNEVDPELVLREAKRLVKKMRESEKPSLNIWDYVADAFESIQLQEKKEFWRRTPAYQVVAVMYILLNLSRSVCNWREESFLREVSEVVFSRRNFNCTQAQADAVVEKLRLQMCDRLFSSYMVSVPNCNQVYNIYVAGDFIIGDKCVENEVKEVRSNGMGIQVNK